MAKNVTPNEVQARLERGEKIVVIDVREPGEWSNGHIKGAKHIPLATLDAKATELFPEEEFIMVCHSGGRSAMATSLLERKGFKNVSNMLGGMSSWGGEVAYD